MDPDSKTDSDPDPAIFVIDLQDASKKLIFNTIEFFLLITLSYFYLSSYIYIIFQRQKVKKSHKNGRNQGFSYYFCMMIEGSGSGRPKNMWIRWIRIRIRIRNTDM
jgi:hypothetical protein